MTVVRGVEEGKEYELDAASVALLTLQKSDRHEDESEAAGVTFEARAQMLKKQSLESN